MTKAGGRYYLQYGRPAPSSTSTPTAPTSGNKPLGPFNYAPYNPDRIQARRFRPWRGPWLNLPGQCTAIGGTRGRRGSATTGRSSGASTCFRPHSITTARWLFQRRFADFPHYVPTGKIDDPDNLFTGWMLLSYRKRGDGFFDAWVNSRRTGSPMRIRAHSGSREPNAPGKH